MAILDWISVGKVAAERDKELTNYFYDAGVSKQIVENPNVYLMLGRKGAGKTAVFLHLSSKPSKIFSNNDIVLSLSLTNYSWNAHALLQHEEKANSISFRDSWRFVILIESIRGLVYHYEQKGETIPKEIAIASKILEKIFAKPVPSWIDLLGEKLYKLSKIKLPSADLGQDLSDLSVDVGEISFEDIRDNSTLKNILSSNINNLTDQLERLLLNGIREKKVFVLFDRLDEAWDTSSFDTCKHINTGLILASDYINQKFSGKIRPIAFLREDIFETLELNDKNKHRKDSGSILKWDRESLQKLMLIRINYFARKAGQAEISDLNSLFDRKEVRSRTTPVNYITRSTFMRPRDVISFYSTIIEAMKDEKDGLESEDPDSEEFTKISNTDHLYADIIYTAEAAYSEWLKEEIKDEWETQLPEIKTYLDALTNIGKSVITKVELTNQLQQTFGKLEPARIRSILQFLFDTSIIGVKVGSIWRYKSVYPSQGFSESMSYKIHYGLTKVLSLTETSS